MYQDHDEYSIYHSLPDIAQEYILRGKEFILPGIPKMRKRQRGYLPPSSYRHKRGRAAPRRRRRGWYKGEVKFSDHQLADTAMSTSWQTLNPTTVNTLSGIAQGTTESEHLGRTAYLRSIHMKGTITLPLTESTAGPSGDEQVRIALVLSQETQGTELDPVDVFDVGQTDDLLAFRNLQEISRIKVYFDKTYVLRPQEMNEGSVNLFAHGARIIHFQINRRFKKPLRVLFSNTSTAVGSIVDNSFHFCCIADTTNPTVRYQVRVRFTERE